MHIYDEFLVGKGFSLKNPEEDLISLIKLLNYWISCNRDPFFLLLVINLSFE